MRTTIVLTLALLLAPLAHAQEVSYIGCAINGSPGVDCTETPYGLGNPGPEPPFGPGSLERTWIGTGAGECGLPNIIPLQGQMRLRELDDCDVSASNRCMVEIPQRIDQSGFFLSVVIVFDLGPLGLVAISANTHEDVGRAGNIGHRQLQGSCTDDGGEECALDSDCPSGTGCLSTCFASNGTTLCASQADCPNADCVTEIEWDGIGTCTDDTTFCTDDADCSGDDFCEGGLDWERSDFTCACCQSATGAFCGLVNLPEYPGLGCPEPQDPETAANMSPDWVFEGGAGTPIDLEQTIFPGQQEGKCTGNDSRPCGQKGDFWAGGANGKCTNPGSCADPFAPANPALASTCDDVAFGGIEGDTCNFVEPGIREDRGLNADGTPDLAACAEAVFDLVGFPNSMCAIADILPTGDPQAGCLLANLGIATRPDLDCNGIDDTTEGRCMPVDAVICTEPGLCPPCDDDSECASGNCINNGDLCPFIGEVNWFEDRNNDDIGDECQCGDQTGDGNITALDIGGTAQCANGQLGVFDCDPTVVDTNADGVTTAIDISGVAQAANGVLATSALRCVSLIDTSG